MKVKDGNSSQGSQRDKTVTLPKINQVNGIDSVKKESKLTTNTGELVDNPFYVPDDYEVTYHIYADLQTQREGERPQDVGQGQEPEPTHMGEGHKAERVVHGGQTQGYVQDRRGAGRGDAGKAVEINLYISNIVDAANSAIKNRVR